MTERCLASGGEAEETGHSEESGMEGEVEWSGMLLYTTFCHRMAV